MGRTKVENIVTQRGRGGRLAGHQLPDAHRRHPAPRSGHAAHPHPAHRRGAGRQKTGSQEIGVTEFGVRVTAPDFAIGATSARPDSDRLNAPTLTLTPTMHAHTSSRRRRLPHGKDPGALRAGAGFESLGRSGERSSKHNREVDRRHPLFPGLAAGGPRRSRRTPSPTSTGCWSQFERNITARGAKVLYAEERRGGQPARPRHRPPARRQDGGQVEVDGHRGDGAEPRAGGRTASGRWRPTWANTWCNWPGSGRSTSSRPALHMSAADVGRLFAEKLGEPFTAEHQQPDGHRPQAPPRRIPPRRHGRLRRQFRHGRHGHDGAWWRTRATPASRPPPRRSTWP